MNLTLFAVAGLLALCLIVLGLRGGRGHVLITLACLMAGPAMLAGAVAGDQSGDAVQATVSSLSLPLTQGSVRTVGVGGDSQDDEFIVRGAPERVVQIIMTGEGPPVLEAPEIAPGTDGAAMVTETRAGASTTLGSSDLRPGDLVCLANCERSEGWLRFRSDHRFEAGVMIDDAFQCRAGCGRGASLWERLRGRTAEMESHLFPRMRARSFAIVPDVPGLPDLPNASITGLAHWPATQRIYPLRDYGRDARVSLEDDPCLDRFLCTGVGADRAPVRSFVHRVGGPWFRPGSGDYRIVLLEPGAVLRRGALTVEPATLSHAPLTEAPVSVSIRPVRYLSADFDPREAGAPAARLLSETRLDILATATVLSITPASPPRSSTSYAPAVRRFELRGAPQADANAPVDTAVIVFDEIGGDLSQDLRSTLSRGQRSGEVVDGVWRGDGEPAAGARFTVDLLWMGRPWSMVVTATAFAAILALSLWRPLGAAPLAVAAVGVLQLLLALRWLASTAGARLDPSLDPEMLSAANALLYLGLPALFVTAWMRLSAADIDQRKLAPPLIFALVASAAPYLFGVRPDAFDILPLIGLALTLAVIALPVLIDGDAGRGLAKLGQDVRARASKAASTISARLSPAVASARRLWRRVTDVPNVLNLIDRPIATLLFVTVVLRLAVMAAGVKERITWPLSLAVSAVYLPFVIIGLSMILARKADPRRTEWRIATAFLVFWALVMAAPSVLSDKGFMLVYGPVTAFVALAVRLNAARAAGAWRAAFLWAVPALVSALLLVGPIASFNLQRLTPIATGTDVLEGGGRLSELAAMSTDEAIATLNGFAAMSSDEIRGNAFLDPHGIMGTRAAEASRIWAQYLDAFTSRFEGRGYGAPANLGDLRAVQLDDNVSAIHLMAPFGRIGAIALLAALAAFAWLAWVMTPASPEDRRPWVRLSGLIGLWVVFGAAAYMILANLRLVLFTGRNVYLLGAASSSDAVEGSVLLVGSVLLLGWWMARGRTGEPTS